MKQHQTEHIHNRYYIALHYADGTIGYVQPGNIYKKDADKEFSTAKLYATFKGASSYAQQLVKYRNDVKVRIGKVTVVVDGYFAPVVVDKKFDI